jgi:acyl dehydratase
MMFSLEKMARAHAAPELLVRAAHGTCACALSLGLAEAKGPLAEDRALAQLVSALVRFVTASLKAGVPVESVVRCLGEAEG